jgi:hypothetical protein
MSVSGSDGEPADLETGTHPIMLSKIAAHSSRAISCLRVFIEIPPIYLMGYFINKEYRNEPEKSMISWTQGTIRLVVFDAKTSCTFGDDAL